MYAYAKTGDLGALEEFISGAQQANLQARTLSHTMDPCGSTLVGVKPQVGLFRTWSMRPHRVS